MSSERAGIGIVLLLSLAFCGVAFAQEAEPSEGDAVPAQEEPAQEEVVDPRFEEARARFRQGLALAEAGNCSGAIAELNASLEILPRANTLFNIARCQETLNRYDLALQAYEDYLELAAPDDPDRPTVEATMRQLRNLLGTIHISSNVPAEVWLGERVVGESPGDVLVPGGRHVIELRADGYLPVRREVEVSAHAEASVEVELTRGEQHEHFTTNVSYESPPLPPALTVAMLGVSVVAIGVGVGFGVNALLLSNQENARDSRLPRDPASIEESALFADIFFIAGGVLTAATVAMGFLTDWSDGADAERAREEAEAGPSVRVIPIVGPLFAGVRVEGIE